MVSAGDIERVVLEAMENTNLSRPPDQHLELSPTAQIFGPGSPLDSLGLVALLIDVEEALRDLGMEVTLSDERAVSQRTSPFRSVPALTAYILSLSHD